MKKRVCSLAVMLVLLISVTAQAVEPRVISPVPVISFNGTTAYCSVDCVSNNDNDRVTATMTLYQGSNIVEEWNGTDYGEVFLSGSCPVKRGKTYTLTVDYAINGIAKPSVSVTETCPWIG
jgi:hypothetical protein